MHLMTQTNFAQTLLLCNRKFYILFCCCWERDSSTCYHSPNLYCGCIGRKILYTTARYHTEGSNFWISAKLFWKSVLGSAPRLSKKCCKAFDKLCILPSCILMYFYINCKSAIHAFSKECLILLCYKAVLLSTGWFKSCSWPQHKKQG